MCADKNRFYVSGCFFEDVSVQIKNHFYVSGCLFEDVSGFIRKVCRRNGEPFYQCPHSQELYKVNVQCKEFQQLSIVCPEDKYHYAACYRLIFAPLTFNNTVVAVSGYYVCSYYGYRVYSGELINYPTWCNNRVKCYNGHVDEKYCTVEEEKMFQCRAEDSTVWFHIYISKVCDC